MDEENVYMVDRSYDTTTHKDIKSRVKLYEIGIGANTKRSPYGDVQLNRVPFFTSSTSLRRDFLVYTYLNVLL